MTRCVGMTMAVLLIVSAVAVAADRWDVKLNDASIPAQDGHWNNIRSDYPTGCNTDDLLSSKIKIGWADKPAGDTRQRMLVRADTAALPSVADLTLPSADYTLTARYIWTFTKFDSSVAWGKYPGYGGGTSTDSKSIGNYSSMLAYRLTTDWSTVQGGLAWPPPTTEDGSSWNYAQYTETAWASPGAMGAGDIDPTPLNNNVVTTYGEDALGNPVERQYYGNPYINGHITAGSTDPLNPAWWSGRRMSVSLPGELIQNWADGTWDNNGILLATGENGCRGEVYDTGTSTWITDPVAAVGGTSGWNRGDDTPAFVVEKHLIGDANRDGAVDIGDFNVLAQYFGRTVVSDIYEPGGPGFDSASWTAFLAANPVPGDYTGTTNQWVCNNYEWVYEDWADGTYFLPTYQVDFNNDGTIDIGDFNILAGAFGNSEGGGGAPVPEPASILLLTVGSAVLGILRKRRRA